MGFRIKGISDQSAAFARVNEKSSADGFQRDQRQSGQQDPKERKNPEAEKFEVTEKEVRDAIGQFSQENQTRHLGVQAEVIGQGPGLRVVLKDGTGAFLRQMTGEEFLKLRETVAGASGKILDQKL